MITIIYIVPSLIYSGPINVLYNIVRHLDRTRFRLVIVALGEHELAHRNNSSQFTDLGIEIISLRKTKWQLQFHYKSIAKEILSRYLGDEVIFHAHGYYPTLIVSEMKGAKTIATIHNICDQDFRMRKGRWMGGYMSYRFKQSLKKLSVAIPICDSMKLYYDCPSLRLTTVYNGVEQSNYMLPETEAVALRRELLCDNQRKILFYPAAFSFRKMHARIISELKESTRTDFQVVFAGQGELMEKCKAQAKGDDRFTFLGYRKDVANLWTVSDFMISASLSEGLPMAVLEATLRGVPCLLSDIPPHREILSKVMDDFDNWIFNLATEGALRRLVEKALDSTFDKNVIRNRALSLYSSEAMAKSYERVYREICGNIE